MLFSFNFFKQVSVFKVYRSLVLVMKADDEKQTESNLKYTRICQLTEVLESHLSVSSQPQSLFLCFTVSFKNLSGNL